MSFCIHESENTKKNCTKNSLSAWLLIGKNQHNTMRKAGRHSRKMRRNMKEWNKGTRRRTTQRAKRSERKKSQILYFDIFYVDSDSTAELYRGLPRLSEQFLMNMSLVSRYLQIPSVILKEKHEHMKWCIVFCSLSARFIREDQHAAAATTFSQPHEGKELENNFLLNFICLLIILNVKYMLCQKRFCGLLRDCKALLLASGGVERQRFVVTVKQRENLYAGVTVRTSHEIGYFKPQSVGNFSSAQKILSSRISHSMRLKLVAFLSKAFVLCGQVWMSGRKLFCKISHKAINLM